jgi:hypothetical protein
MDRRAIAREGRQAQALDALQFERDRESALLAQIAEIVLEQEGDRVDGDAFARLSPEDVQRVREALGYVGDPSPEDEPLVPGDEMFVTFQDEASLESGEEELERLAAEIEECRARQGALERYVQVLVEEEAREEPPLVA